MFMTSPFYGIIQFIDDKKGRIYFEILRRFYDNR